MAANAFSPGPVEGPMMLTLFLPVLLCLAGSVTYHTFMANHWNYKRYITLDVSICLYTIKCMSNMALFCDHAAARYASCSTSHGIRLLVRFHACKPDAVCFLHCTRCGLAHSCLSEADLYHQRFGLGATAARYVYTCHCTGKVYVCCRCVACSHYFCLEPKIV